MIHVFQSSWYQRLTGTLLTLFLCLYSRLPNLRIINILNPQLALSPMPMAIAMIISFAIILTDLPH
jgi:hypothetical protein